MNGIATRDLSRLHLLYAEDAVVEHPFALPSPGRMQGRGALKAHFERFAEAPFTLAVHDMVVHQKARPGGAEPRRPPPFDSPTRRLPASLFELRRTEAEYPP